MNAAAVKDLGSLRRRLNEKLQKWLHLARSKPPFFTSAFPTRRLHLSNRSGTFSSAISRVPGPLGILPIAVALLRPVVSLLEPISFQRRHDWGGPESPQSPDLVSDDGTGALQRQRRRHGTFCARRQRPWLSSFSQRGFSTALPEVIPSHNAVAPNRWNCHAHG